MKAWEIWSYQPAGWPEPHPAVIVSGPARESGSEQRFATTLFPCGAGKQQIQRTLLDWLRVEYAIEKPSNKLLAATALDSDT
jgi:hypothetical protein